MIKMKQKNADSVRREFRRLSQLGHGRAFLVFRDNPHIDFTKDIISLCVHDYTYDAQCEGNRSEYAMQFVRALSPHARAKVIAAVKKRLQGEAVSNSWHYEHLCITAAKIAREFDGTLGDILRTLYAACDDDTVYRVFPESVLLELDGFEGLIAVAQRKGKAFLDNSDWWETDSLFYALPSMEGSEVEERLKTLAQTNRAIRAYLEVVRQTEESQQQCKKEYEASNTENVFERVKALVSAQKRVSPLAAKKLTTAQLAFFADGFKACRTQKERFGYLRLFSPTTRIPYPADAHDLLSRISRRTNCLYNEYLIDSLSFFSSPELRALAERALESDEYGFFYLALLEKNYRTGDGERIEKRLRALKNKDELHTATRITRNIYKANTNADCLLPLRFIYETTPCSLCRSYVIALMEKANVLPSDIKTEIQFDSLYKLNKDEQKGKNL